MDAIVSTIGAMRRQEQKAYICRDYLYQQQQEAALTAAVILAPVAQQPVTSDCREKMVQWCYKVVDFCHFNRETVAIAVSIMDRFMASGPGKAVVLDRNQFQLVAMTSLYTAVKIHEPEVMSADLVSQLSRGTHSEEEIELMERRILKALTWQVNPPTILSFVREFIKLLPPALVDGDDIQVTLYEMCKFQSELAVADAALIGVAASTIAYSTLMNSLESLHCMDHSILGYVGSILSQAAHINLYSLELPHVQSRLCQAVAQNMQATNTTTAKVPTATHVHATTTAMVGCGGGAAPRRSSYKASPCTVTRMEV